MTQRMCNEKQRLGTAVLKVISALYRYTTLLKIKVPKGGFTAMPKNNHFGVND